MDTEKARVFIYSRKIVMKLITGRLKTARPPSARPAAPRLKEKTELLAEEVMQARYSGTEHSQNVN
jgi:hypothetical protein